MPKRRINLSLDFSRKDNFPKFEVKQFDSLTLNITPLENGIAYSTANCTAKLYVGCYTELYKQETDITVNNNNIVINVDKNMLNKKCAAAYAEIELTDNLGIVTSSTFIFSIVEKIGEGSNIPGQIDGFVAKYEKLISEFKLKVDNSVLDSENRTTDAINNVNINVDNKINDIETRFNILTSQQQQDAEVILARKGETSLRKKIDKIDEQFISIETKVTKIFNVKEFLCDDGQHVKGDGIHDDTTGIQKAIDYCSANCCDLFFSKGIYYITDTIEIFKSSTGRHQFRIDFNTSQIMTDKEITMVRIDNKSDTTYAQGWSVYIDNLNLNGRRKALVGLHNKSQGACIDSLYIDQCQVGLKSENVYYCTFEGHHIINNSNIGIQICGNENNATNFRNMWIVGGARYDEVNSIGIDIQTKGFDMVISDITIESYATAIKQTYNDGTLALTIRNCYFELIRECLIDIANSTVICNIEGCHSNESKSALKQSGLKLGGGTFTVFNNNFKDNIIEIMKIYTNVDTNMEVKIYEKGSSNGWQQVVTRKPNSMTINSLKDYYKNSEIILRLEKLNQLCKLYPVTTVMDRDITFLNGGIVLTSPNGKYFRVVVDDTGQLSTEKIGSQGERVLMAYYNTLNINEVINNNLSEFYFSKFTLQETNGTYDILNGVPSLTSGYAKGLNAYGNISYIIDSLTNIITAESWWGIYIYNTDINKFYVLQGNYWAWAGDKPSVQATITRAIGTTSQRPSGITVGFIYYDTDLKTYVKWNGSSWVNN